MSTKHTHATRIAIASAAMLCAISWSAHASTTTALPPLLDLAQEPLLGKRPLHPNVALALSVEFPTVGAAFNRIRYESGKQYVGYFDSNTCYTYDTTTSITDINGNASTGFFVRSGAATNYTCSDAFSGNFLNWATMSSIDIFRYAMTGGYRLVDSTSQTILERAFLPNGNSTSSGINQPSNFYAHNSYFPRRWVSTTETGNNGNIGTVAPSTVTPFSITRMSVVSCRNEVLFGQRDSSGSPSCDTPLTDGRFPTDDASVVRRYKVRVLVCDGTEGPARAPFCGIYRDGSTVAYKPIGQIQRNAENMRFAAFGYLMQQSNARYGGVLRAPMKYVGPNLYDSSFRLTGANGALEWSATTGVFAINPNGATEGNSGVVNYLNKFGSLPGSEGVYKAIDPVGELYYEAMRYLQGKAASAAATSGMTEAQKQSFPVTAFTTSDDPLVCAAQPQYIITIADTNAWGDKTLPGNTYTSQNDTARATEDGLDVLAMVREMGLRAKADGLLPVTSGAISSTQANTLDTWVDGGRGNSFGMAGLAYWAGPARRDSSGKSNADVRPDVDGQAKTLGQQMIRSITIDVAEPSGLQPKERQLFLAGAYGSDDPKNNPNWAMADNPQRLIDAIDSAFARVSSTSGSIGGGTITSGIFEVGETGVFVPLFDTQSWAGELQYFPITPVLDADNKPTGAVAFASSASWVASSGIPTFNESNNTDTRTIVLGNRLGGGVNFQWSNLTSAQQTLFNTNPRTLQNDGLGERRLRFLRGSRADEGVDPETYVGELPEGADGTLTGSSKPFRIRSKLLADIVNSAPVYVGKPRAAIPDLLVPTSSYRTWSTNSARQTRTPAVYVGTNGGLVHAFNATSGAELFSYIPSAVLNKLPKLTHPGYTHEAMVDGPLAATEAYAQSSWRSVLSGSFGVGAKGVFALDVTNPSTFSTSNVMWEFTEQDDPDMGHVTGRVLIAPIAIKNSLGTVENRWFVITSSGYNNYRDSLASDNGQGYVFFLSLDKASGDAWSLGTNYYKIALPFDATSTAANGVSQPGAVYNRFGLLTNLYLGDLRGNLWRVDVNSTTQSSWKVAYNNDPVFVAQDTNGNRQPITAPPSIAYGPGTGYYVLFGTGRMLANGDNLAREATSVITAFDSQSVYTVWDNLNNTVSGRSVLQERTATFSGDTATITGSAISYGSGTGQKRGWFIDLPAATNNGERVVSQVALGFGRVYINTVVPGADPCGRGQSRTYNLAVNQGTGSAKTSTVGYLARPLVLRTLVITGASDPTGRRTDRIRIAAVNLGTDDKAIVQENDGYPVAAEWTWREILNWREMRR